MGLAVAAVLPNCTSPDPRETSAPVPAAVPEAAADVPPPPPPLPAVEYRRLADSVTYIDYLFFEQAFSMSMSEPAAIRYAIEGISPEAATPRQACAAMGRLFYKIDGRTVREADLHFAPGCTYLAFYGADKRVAYANELSDEGKAFFNNQFRRLIPNYTDIE